MQDPANGTTGVAPRCHLYDIGFYRGPSDFCASWSDFNFSPCQLAIHRNTGPPSPLRSKCGAALTISYNRISERLESAKRLHRYLNFADDGNHARLDTSIARFVGFLRLGYFTIGSNPPRWWSGMASTASSRAESPRNSRSPSNSVRFPFRFRLD